MSEPIRQCGRRLTVQYSAVMFLNPNWLSFSRLSVNWKVHMVLVSGIFITGVVGNIIQATPQSSFDAEEFVILLVCALTLFEFGIGDLVLLETVEKCWRPGRKLPVRQLAQNYAIYDVFFAWGHAVTLALFAWFATSSICHFSLMLNILAGINAMWLAMRIMAFSEIIELERNPAFKESLIKCRKTAFHWLILNSLYVIAAALLGFWLGTGKFPVCARSTLLALASLRTLIDLACGWSLYTAQVIRG